ncbi:MAG: glyoxalase [Chloroflexi bacterium]|nr:MAG: glyoxalase [Chloroflexota bacterium]TMG23053.1 MAG: glyoxalase [Chloroflexota bacterium]
MLRVTFRGMAKLNAVGFVVTDLERAVKFYRLLGVPFPEGAEKSEHGHADVVLDGGMRLMIDTEDEMRKFDPSWKRAGGSPAAALAFDCESPNAVDELYAKALSAGGRTHKEPWDAFWGQRYAQLRDPDGNGVDLYANLPSQS